jgi:hypothetical protein
MTTEGADGEPTLVDHALDQWLTMFDHLLRVVEDGGLDHYDNPQLVGFLQSYERMRNQMPLIDHRVIRDSLSRDLPGALCQTGMTRVLTPALRLSRAEASRRVNPADRHLHPDVRADRPRHRMRTPPKWVDRAQRPLMNNRIIAKQLTSRPNNHAAVADSSTS